LVLGSHIISTLDVRRSEALPHKNGRASCAYGDRSTLPGLDQMSEQDLIAELHRVADACERLDQEVTRAAQWQRFCNGAHEASRGAQKGQILLAEMSRLMDRRRAIEGYLMRVRGQLRPLKQDE
jgi:hypothetical protein